MISTFNILEELATLTKEVEAFHGYVQKTAAAIEQDTDLLAIRSLFMKQRRKMMKTVNSSANIFNFPGTQPKTNYRRKKLEKPERSQVRKDPCFYCGVYESKTGRTIDHFIPLAMRGSNRKENLVAACSTCNSVKGARLPTPGEIRKFQVERPSVPLNLLLEPYGFLTDIQQLQFEWFRTVWAAHISAYRNRL